MESNKKGAAVLAFAHSDFKREGFILFLGVPRSRFSACNFKKKSNPNSRTGYGTLKTVGFGVWGLAVCSFICHILRARSHDKSGAWFCRS